MKTKMISALLALMMLGAFFMIACGETASVPSSDTADTAQNIAAETVTDGETDRGSIRDNVPEMDLEGEQYTFFIANQSKENTYYQGPEEETGDVVYDAVYTRNRSVEERLNCTLNCIFHEETSGNTINETFNKLIMAGDTTYDVMLGQQYGLAKMVAEGGMENVYDVDYLDLEQPWWWKDYIAELSLSSEKAYFLAGDFFIDTLFNTRAVYFNKRIYESYYGDPATAYETVLNGKWTLDLMTEQASGAYIDLDNNGVTDSTDQVGYLTYSTGSSVDAFVYATDVQFSHREDDDSITLSLISEDAVTLCEKLNKMFWQDGSFHKTGGEATPFFLNCNILFLGNATLYSAQSLRDMTDDFGFLPYPKFDEQQENYRALVHDSVLIGMIPVTTQKLDTVGAVVEALCAETYRSVTPSWYETALKIKYSRDDLSTQMIDLIHDSITTNFVFAYNYALNGIGLVYRTTVTNNSNDYVSAVTKLIDAGQAKLDELYEIFNEQ